MQTLRTTYGLAEHCWMMTSLALKFPTNLTCAYAHDTRIDDPGSITRTAGKAIDLCQTISAEFDAPRPIQGQRERLPAWNCAEPYEVDCKQPTWLAGH